MKLNRRCTLIFILTLSLIRYIHSTNYNELMHDAYQHAQQHNYAAALELYKKVSTQFPTHSALLGNIAYLYKKMHNESEAIIWYERALNYDPHNPRLKRGIAHAYLATGDYTRGWPAYEYRWVTPPAYNKKCIDYIQSGSALINKKIIIHAEYGLGDTLQFIRYALLLKNMGAYIIVQSHKRLIPLLSLCSYIDCIIGPDDILPAHDLRIMVMSLPLVFNTTIDTIPAQPYLYSDYSLYNSWRPIVAQHSGISVGICWRADMRHTSQDAIVQEDAYNKSIPFEQLEPLWHLPNVTFYNLVHELTPEEKQLAKNTPLIIHEHLDTLHGPFMDSAALIQNLDFILTVDTSIAHLSGGLNAHTILLLPYHADWRWLKDTDRSPWYPTMYIFRQKKLDDWKTIIEAAINHLKL